MQPATCSSFEAWHSERPCCRSVHSLWLLPEPPLQGLMFPGRYKQDSQVSQIFSEVPLPVHIGG